MCDSYNATLRVGDSDGVTGLGVAPVGNVARKDPRVAAGRAIRGFAIDFDQIQ